jgi:hypothetical protein
VTGVQTCALPISEARKLGIPVAAVLDSNSNPDGITYPIPGNDDAMRAISLYSTFVADAVLDGKASLPEVVLGDDEFVELDEDGKPKKAAARKRPGAKKAARPTRKVVVTKPVGKKSATSEAGKPADAVADDAPAGVTDHASEETATVATAAETDAPAAAEAVLKQDASAEVAGKEAAPAETAEEKTPATQENDSATDEADTKAASKKAVTKKAATKKAAPKKAATKKAAAKKAAPKKAAVKKTATKKAAAKKTAAKTDDKD